MDDASTLSVDAYLQRMQGKMQLMLRAVGEAVRAAPDGAWINASEMRVRDVFGEFRREAYETALQMRLDARQAAFSPGGRSERAAAVQQGIGEPQHADDQRSGGPVA
jgi:hypothetical protein